MQSVYSTALADWTIHRVNVKTVLFQMIQFSISTQFKCKNRKLSRPQLSSIWPIDRTLSIATTPIQSGPGSDGNEGVLHIPQSPSITGTSPSNFLGSYTGHSLRWEGLTPLQRCSRCILQSQLTGQEYAGVHIYIYIYIYIYILFLVILVQQFWLVTMLWSLVINHI